MKSTGVVRKLDDLGRIVIPIGEISDRMKLFDEIMGNKPAEPDNEPVEVEYTVKDDNGE